MKKVLRKEEVLHHLEQGKIILWNFDKEGFHAFLENDMQLIVRRDTLVKLWREEKITDFGYPQLHGAVKLKQLRPGG